MNTAFDNWLTGFSVTGGFNPQGTISGTPVAPVLCEGGTTTVTYNVTDECGSGSETATFTINTPSAVAVTEVNDLTTSSCTYADQAAADAAFALWLDGFGVTGGCSPAFTNGTPVAPAYCGGNTLVTWTVTDHCYLTSTHTATFTINTPAAVMVTEVSDLTTPAGDYADQAAINTAFTNWLNGFASAAVVHHRKITGLYQPRVCAAAAPRSPGRSPIIVTPPLPIQRPLPLYRPTRWSSINRITSPQHPVSLQIRMP